MATVIAQDIVDRAQIILQDTTAVRWPTLELIDWLNDGQREIALLRPEAFSTNTSMQLAAGTKQSLPSAGIRLLDVIRNMGTDGSTAGNAIRLVDREVLDAQIVGWHAATATAVVKHYIYDGRDPRKFYVYPPSLGTTYIEIIYSSSPSVTTASATITGATQANPVVITAVAHGIATGSYIYISDVVGMTQLNGNYYTTTAVTTDTFALSGVNGTGYTAYVSGGVASQTITLDDVYANALLDYVLYRAYLKDAEYTANSERVNFFYKSFMQALGLKYQVDQSVNPNRTAPPYNPASPGLK